MRNQILPKEVLNEHAQFLIRTAFWTQIHTLEDELNGLNIYALDEKVLECYYHFAAMFTDLMTIKSGEIVLREIRLRERNKVASHLFARGLTGDYRDEKYFREDRIPPDITAYSEIFQRDVTHSTSNTPEENAEIITQLNRTVGKSIFSIIHENEHHYLKSRLPKDFVRDTVEHDRRSLS